MLTAIWGLCSMIPLFLMILKTPILRLRCLWCSEPLKTNFEKKKKTGWDKVDRKHVE